MALRALRESLTDEYFERVDERIQKASTICKRITSIVALANLAENHLARYRMAASPEISA